MRKKHYIMIKDKKEKNASFKKIKNKKFKIKPKNKVKYEGIVVDKLTVYDDKFIERILKKKIKRKLDQYLNYIINYLDESDDDGVTDLRHALNDLTRYKNIIYNKYRKHLDDKYVELLMQKIALLEYEINHKLMYLETYDYYENYFYQQEYEEEKGKAR